MTPEKYKLLPEVRTEQDYLLYEEAVNLLVSSLGRDFDQMVTELFPEEFDAWLLSLAIETACSEYQTTPFKRLDPHFIQEEKRIDCVSTALILGKKWRQKSPGNSAVYFVQKKSAQADQEDRVVGGGNKGEALAKKKESASQAHVIVGLLPSGIAQEQIYEEYLKFKKGEPTPVKFYHYDYRKGNGKLHSIVIPLEPDICDLGDFQRINSDAELLRHRVRVYFAPTKENRAAYEATFTDAPVFS
jgi:hypothetical protein